MIAGKWPAIVRAVDRARREIRVEIPGVTDGAEELPLAQIAYSIGDKSEHTEIRVIVGDRVWVEFERGDPRFPLITHWRTKQTGNDLMWRRWHHENIERVADGGDIHDSASRDILTEAGRNEARQIGQVFTLDAGTRITLHVGSSTITIQDGTVTVATGTLTVNANSIFNGNVAINGNQVVSGAVGVGGALSAGGGITGQGGLSFEGHKHREQGDGNLVSPPQN